MITSRYLLRRVFLAICAAFVMVCAWLHPLDERATTRVEDGLRKALVTYGTARVLHGTVSALQGTQVNFEPGGVGTTFTPGQILAPAAEMLKQFADVMLVVCVAFGIQKLLIGIAAHWIMSVALTASSLAWLWAMSTHRRPPDWLTKTFIILLTVQLAVPITVLMTDKLSDRILGTAYQAAQQAIDPGAASKEVAAQPSNVENDKRPMADRIKEWFDRKAAAPMVEYESLKSRVDKASEHIVRLIAVFVLQTIILPLLLLWALYGIARSLLHWRAEVGATASRQSS